jgi:hypothetical protein
MSGVDAMLDKITARQVANGEPCVVGICGRTSGVQRPDGTRGACPTCETQHVLWLAFWAAMGVPGGI